MRQGLAFVGLGALVILIGLIVINQRFTRPADNEGTSVMATSTLTLTSTAFQANSAIPSKYTCDGTQVSPPLSIAGAPEGTQSFVLILEDPDVPKQLVPTGVFVHWVLFNIPGSLTEITEGAQVGTAGANGAGKNAYAPPCPPTQYEPSEHRYIFTLYALDANLSLKAGASKDEVMKATQGHILAQSQFIGRYKKK
jgi:Raf kinase inhibitor-like YbhB/YbcL family protein